MFEKIMLHIRINLMYVIISILLYMTSLIQEGLYQVFAGLAGFVLILFAAEVTQGVKNHEDEYF